MYEDFYPMIVQLYTMIWPIASPWRNLTLQLIKSKLKQDFFKIKTGLRNNLKFLIFQNDNPCIPKTCSPSETKLHKCCWKMTASQAIIFGINCTLSPILITLPIGLLGILSPAKPHVCWIFSVSIDDDFSLNYLYKSEWFFLDFNKFQWYLMNLSDSSMILMQIWI